MARELFKPHPGRRTGSKSKRDEIKFPVRVRFKAGGSLAGARVDDLHCWLRDEIGRGNYGVHGAGWQTDHAVSVYLRTTLAAEMLVNAFPDFELADFTDHGQ